MQSHGEESVLNDMFKLLNENLTAILAQQENNEQNLMYMFDIIFNLVKYTPSKSRMVIVSDMANSLLQS